MDNNGLYALQKKDLTKAGEILADAFREDPVWKAFFDSGDAPDRMRTASFATPVAYCMKFGTVCAPSAEIEGVAAWLPGKFATMNVFRLLRSGALKYGLRMGAEFGRKMKKIFAPLDEDRKSHMKEREFVYLQVIGVAGKYQEKGYGRKMLRELFAQSDAAGLPVYLETETESNVAMYEKYGFKTVKKISLQELDLPMWEMVREPKT